MAFQSFILRTARHTLLIDTCTGNDKERPNRPEWRRQNNDFLKRMARAGVDPENVDFVFCTHLHADHTGWNTQDVAIQVSSRACARFVDVLKSFMEYQPLR